jgi:hypothetical protein
MPKPYLLLTHTQRKQLKIDDPAQLSAIQSKERVLRIQYKREQERIAEEKYFTKLLRQSIAHEQKKQQSAINREQKRLVRLEEKKSAERLIKNAAAAEAKRLVILDKLLKVEVVIEPEPTPKPAPVKQLRTNRDHWLNIIAGMRTRALKKNIPFDVTITPEYMMELCPTHCPVLGTELIRAGHDHWSRPSVDRLVPSAGYVRGNIIVVSLLANTVRNCATADQILAVGNFYKLLLTERGIVEG